MCNLINTHTHTHTCVSRIEKICYRRKEALDQNIKTSLQILLSTEKNNNENCYITDANRGGCLSFLFPFPLLSSRLQMGSATALFRWSFEVGARSVDVRNRHTQTHWSPIGWIHNCSVNGRLVWDRILWIQNRVASNQNRWLWAAHSKNFISPWFSRFWATFLLLKIGIVCLILWNKEEVACSLKRYRLIEKGARSHPCQLTMTRDQCNLLVGGSCDCFLYQQGACNPGALVAGHGPFRGTAFLWSLTRELS